MFEGVRQVYLFCKNVEESVAWYEQFLNFTQEQREAVKGQFALIKISNIEFCFHAADDKSPVSTGGTVAYWAVPNLNLAIEKAQRLGATLYRGPIQIHDTPRWMAQIKDPYGNVIGVEGACS